MSAETLREAANLMRERAQAAPIEVWGNDSFEFANPDKPFTTYVASWHPDVALAVAEWLDRIAWTWHLDPDLKGRVGGDEALAVALAYLGRDS